MCIFNYLQFIISFREKRGKVCSALLSLAKKLIYQILTSELTPSLVHHGLIRALLALALLLLLLFQEGGNTSVHFYIWQIFLFCET